MILPNYRNSVYNVTHTVLKSFGISGPSLQEVGALDNDRIVLILIDALGMNLHHRCFSEFEAFTTLTSVFPSTTAAAITTVFTGLSPKEHGILEWYMYWEKYGDIIKTIPFSPKKSNETDELERMGYSPEELFALPTIFGILNEKNITTMAHIREDYLNSMYSRFMLRETEKIGFRTLDKIPRLIRKDTEDFIYVYIDDIDIAQHRYGPSSAKVCKVAKKIKRILGEMKKASTSLIITADHGQTEIKKMKKLKVENCKIGGSPRDMFLYCEHIPDENFIDRRRILELLGPGEENVNLSHRVPERIILPEENTGIWHEDFDVRGLHGGMTEDEMLVPLIIFER